MMKSKMMASGGMMKSKMMASGGAMPMKDGKPAFLNDGKGMAKGGMAKMMAAGGMHKMPDGKMMKDSAMAKGGMPPALAKHAAKKASEAHKGLKSGGMTKPKTKMMSSGGSASKRADGIAQRGKTKAC